MFTFPAGFPGRILVYYSYHKSPGGPLMNWFRKLMTGRYGSDQLNLALLVLSIFLTLLARITDWLPLVAISYLPLLFALYRMFSRSIFKRQAENRWFLKYWTPIGQWIRQRITMLRQSKQYRFYRCPSCKMMVRVPRGKGKIEIRCPGCKTAFRRKS